LGVARSQIELRYAESLSFYELTGENQFGARSASVRETATGAEESLFHNVPQGDFANWRVGAHLIHVRLTRSCFPSHVLTRKDCAPCASSDVDGAAKPLLMLRIRSKIKQDPMSIRHAGSAVLHGMHCIARLCAHNRLPMANFDRQNVGAPS
jgi:hypothetical protein